MKKAELQLTKESIINEGIDIKLNQADVIDMLVEEQIDQITSIPQKIKETKDDILKIMKNEWDAYLEKVAKKIPVPKGLTVVTWYTSTSKNVSDAMDSLREYVDNKGTVTYSKNHNSFHSAIEGTLRVKYEGEISGIKVTGESEPIAFKFKHSKKLMEYVAAHNAKLEEFLKIVPEKGINEKEIAKRIKNQFTKEILKTSSPEFRKKLKEGFSIDL